MSGTNSKVQRVIETVEFDHGAGTVFLKDEAGRRVEFSTLSDLKAALEDLVDKIIETGFGWDGDGRYMDNDGYLAYPDPLASTFVESELARSAVPQFFSERDSRQERTLLVDESSAIATAETSHLKVELVDITEELIRYLASHPQKLYEVEPEKFEDLVAAIFRDRGYEVIQTPRSRDGGRDLIAFYKEPFGRILTLIECKRFAQHRRIGPALVRQLYGVVERERASHGILATTTFFTSGAQKLELELQHRLSLRDYNDVIAWCQDFGTVGRRSPLN